MYPGSL